MRRTVLALALVAGAGGLGALAVLTYGADREYQRLIATGDAALASSRPFDALEAYSGALALRPDAMLAYLKRGMTYQGRGELQNAARDLRRAVDLDPSAPRPLELLGDVNAALTRYDRAGESYERYLALDDRSAPVLYKLGLSRYRGGDAGAAVAPLQRAVALEPRLAEAHYLLGLALRDEGRLHESRGSLEEATRLSPGLSAPREALADVYRALGEDRLAIDQLEALVALEPSRPERVVAVGLSLARAGRRDAAVVALSRGIERFPGAAQVYAALGHLWLEVAQDGTDRVALIKAVGALSSAAARSETSTEALTDYARALMLSGDSATAERILHQAIARVPVPPAAYLYLADLHSRAQRRQAARDALVHYATLVGDQEPLGSVPRQIATLSARLGEPRVAVRWFERAIDESGSTPGLLAGLADAVAQSGDISRARALVDEGLSIDPADAALLRVKMRLPQ
ncbi:MAG: tetratricopeptide repeat protein [Vicinamibacterales bacterium]